MRRLDARLARHPRLVRWLLAGPGALAAALLSMASMPLWLPAGAAGIDHLVLPIVLFPLIWSVAFFYACLDGRLGRAALVTVAVIAGQAALLAGALAA